MSAIIIIVIACIITGVAVGWMAGLLGIGGGLIIVPVLSQLLVSVLDIDFVDAIPIAVASSLSTIIFTGFSSAKAHFKLGNLDTKILLYCAVGSAVGGVIGAQFVSRVNGEVITLIIAIVAMLIAMNMLFGKVKVNPVTPSGAVLLSISLVTGVLASIMGVGGGAMLVPALCWFGVALRVAIGCAAASGLVLALFGTLSFAFVSPLPSPVAHLSLGLILLPATFGIAATSVIFAPLGAKYGQSLDTGKLKRYFAFFLIAMSLKFVWALAS